MSVFVYVAGPYTGPDAQAVEDNVCRAMRAGDELEDAGILAFIPHLSHFRHLKCPRTYEEWMEIDFAWLAKCDAMLRLPGASSGADREEVKAAELGIPVFRSVEEVLTWLDQLKQGGSGFWVTDGPIEFHPGPPLMATAKIQDTAKATAEANARGEGFKADSGKADWSLLPLDVVQDIASVLTRGATKYARDNWQKVPDARNRYFAAALRHLTAWQAGEANDPETGLPHLAHAQCCLTFLAWFDKHESKP